jgi:hypothetical protein
MNNNTPQPSTVGPAPEGSTRILLLIASFILPIVGIVLGVLYLQRPDEASRHFARQALIAAIAFFVVFCLCFACYFFFILVLGFAPFFFLPFAIQSSGSLLPFLLNLIL